MSGSHGRCDMAVAFPTNRVADGGISSLTQLLPLLANNPLLVTQADAPCLNAWKRRNGRLLVIPALISPEATRLRGPIARLCMLVRFNLAVFLLCARTRPRVVHCNDTLAMQHAAFGALAAGAHVVFHIRDTKETMSAIERWRWRLYIAMAHRVLCLSSDMVRRWSDSLGGTDLRGRCIHAISTITFSVVDLQRFAQATPSERRRIRDELGIPPGTFLVIAVGIVSRKKGSLGLVRDVAPRIRGNWTLALVGDDHVDATLAAEIRTLAAASCGRIRIMGASQEVWRWYQAADLSVNNARYEGLARCMLESLACGTPMVSTDVCSAREILEDNRCGAVVPLDAPDEMARAVETYMHDRERLRVHGLNGEAVARRLCHGPAVAARANGGLPP